MPKSSSLKRLIPALAAMHFVNDGLVILLPATFPWLIAEFDLSYSAAAMIITACTILSAILQLFTGYMATRVNRITLLFTGLIILGISAFLTGLSTEYLHLLLFQFTLGIGASFYHPIGYALVSDVYGTNKKARGLGYVSSFGDMSILVTFVTSGVLMTTFGWRFIFILSGLVTIIIAVSILLTVNDPRAPVYDRNGSAEMKSHRFCSARSFPLCTHILSNFVKCVAGLHDLPCRLARACRDAKRRLKTIEMLVPMIVVLLLMQSCYKIIFSFSATYLTLLGFSIELAGVAVATMVGTGIIGTYVLGCLTDRFGGEKTLRVLAILLAVLSTLLSYVSLKYYVYLIISLLGVPLLGVYPVLYSIIGERADREARAFTYGFALSVAGAGATLFIYSAGVVADTFGVESIYVMAAILSMAAVAMTYMPTSTR
jgi:FSR family fosmidomycin resistance protein-like MFS transporter